MEKNSIWIFFKKIKKNYLLYGGILIGFIVWMLFLDTHSWTIHSELNGDIDQLELEKEALTKIIESDKNTIKQLQNEDSLERFAREQYGHKKKNETVFIIETTKTPSKN
ncbi:septum formation initiator family protein [Flavobacteriaceae bacterium]|nr:septum formation initiator family protein [Flavobacteriaceae bacterium]